MKRLVRLLPMAAADIAETQFFYEQQSADLGAYFRKCINADSLALTRTAGVHRVVDGFHRVISKRFPSAIFYRVEGDTVLVYAVLDCRRNPDAIRRRLLGG